MIIKAFGNCWAPIVAGKIMDMSCVIWSTTECGQGGSCHVYKDDTFVAGMLALRELIDTCGLNDQLVFQVVFLLNMA